MNRFILTVDALTTFSGGNAPTLEILIGGIPVASTAMSSGTGTYSFLLDFTGSFPSSLALRFDGSSGDPGDTIDLTGVRVNGQALDTATDLTATLLSQGQSSTVDASGNDHLFGRVEPTQADLGTATVTGTGGDDDLFGQGVDDDDIIDASGGDDRVRGLDGEDAINGGAGNDTIFGEADNDIVIAGAGNDLVFGGTGDDLIYGEGDNDTLIGEAGDDVLNGGAGNDGLLGDAGDDILYGEAGDDWLVGGTGDDSLYGDDGNDIIIGGADDDTIYGGNNDDSLFGGTGDDTIEGEAGVDEIDAGAGTDTVDGGAGDDEIYGGDGVDTLSGGADDDYVFGGDGGDILNGDAGIDVLVGGDGADTLNGGTGADFLYGGGLDSTDLSSIIDANPNVSYSYETGSFYQLIQTGVNTSWTAARDAAAATTLNGLAGHLVTVTTQTERDYIINNIYDNTNNAWIGGGDITTEGTWEWQVGPEAGVAFYDEGTSSAIDGHYIDWTTGQPNDSDGSQDYLYILNNNDQWADAVLTGGSGFVDIHDYIIEWEVGAMSDDSAADIINGGAGDDWLYGYGGADTLNGDGDDDNLFGGAGNDTLDGGSGDDNHYGGGGTDTADFTSSGSGVTVDLVAGTATGNGTDTLSSIENVTGSSSADTIDGDGNANVLTGAGGADNVDGAGGNDTLHGDAGNDTLDGGTGNDTINGGADNDTIDGEDGTDTVNGDAGNDTVSGGIGSDTVNGGTGDDTLYALDNGVSASDADDAYTNTLNGGDGDDILYGSTGTDTLNGDDDNDELRSDSVASTAGTVSALVSASADDAEEIISSGNMESLSSSDIEIGIESSGQQIIGLRWQNLDIAQGATITNAYIEFQADESDSAATTLTFTGQDIDSAAAFTTTNSDISSRTQTTASVDWSSTPSWTAGNFYQTPDLSSIVQEIVDRGGWNSGTSDLVIMATGSAGAARVAESFDGNGTAARLIVEYTTAGSTTTLNGGDDDDELYGGEGADILNGGDGDDELYSGSIAGTATVDVLISSGNDDAEEQSDGSMYRNSSDLELIDDGNQQTVGLRWQDIDIAQGSTITNAYIEFEADESDSTSINLTFHGEDVDSALAFGAADDDISDRTTTTASVSWNSIPAWTAGSKYQTPDLSSIVQEIVDRGGWSAGTSDLVIIVTGSSTAERVAESYEGNGTPARLVIEYETPGIDTTILNGQDGLDDLYGSDGTDHFVFESASAFNDVDLINNFSTAGGDALDISDVLVGYTAGVDDITEWVQITDDGTDSTLAIDANGTVGGTSYTDVATILGVIGLTDEATLETNGNIIA